MYNRAGYNISGYNRIVNPLLVNIVDVIREKTPDTIIDTGEQRYTLDEAEKIIKNRDFKSNFLYPLIVALISALFSMFFNQLLTKEETTTHVEQIINYYHIDLSGTSLQIPDGLSFDVPTNLSDQ